ncbi:MAG: hypothetical protein ACD_26C00167G0005 [uncultured bacterium]|nr:MAG: hypothetical protein ACD_26C00167G0005 [uncultured bacterium]
MKEILFNLNFDDFHPQNDENGDFGDLNGEVFEYLDKLWTKFPDLKVTMYTTSNWIDKPFKMSSIFYHIKRISQIKPVVPIYLNEPFRLDKHLDWCEKIKQLVLNGKLEIAIHGYYHHNPNLVIHGQEFLDLDYKKSIERITLAERMFNKCQIPFVKIFRPPGWGFNNNTIKVLKDLKYNAIALNSSGSLTHEISVFHGLKNIPQNYSIKNDPKYALIQSEKTGRVFAKGHVVYKYGKEIVENGLNEKHFNNLMNTLMELNKKYKVKYINLIDLV